MQKKIESIEIKIESIKGVINSNGQIINELKDEKLLNKKEKVQKKEIETIFGKTSKYNFIDELNRVIKINKKLRLIYILLIIISSILIFATTQKWLVPKTVTVKETSNEYKEMENKLISSNNEITNLKIKIDKLQNNNIALSDTIIQEENTEPETEENIINTNSGETLSNSGETLSNSGETLSNSGETLSNSGETLSNSGETLSNSGKTLSNSGETLSNSGETLSNSGETLITSEEIKDIATDEEIVKIIEENKKIIEETGIKKEDFYTCKGSSKTTNKITIRNRPGVDNGDWINVFYPGIKVNVLNYTKVDDRYWYQVITDDKFKGWMSDYGLQKYDINNCISLEKND